MTVFTGMDCGDVVFIIYRLTLMISSKVEKWMHQTYKSVWQFLFWSLQSCVLTSLKP